MREEKVIPTVEPAPVEAARRAPISRSAIPPNDWIYTEAQRLSGSKDADAVGALAWNLSVAFRRWSEESR